MCLININHLVVAMELNVSHELLQVVRNIRPIQVLFLRVAPVICNAVVDDVLSRAKCKIASHRLRWTHPVGTLRIS